MTRRHFHAGSVLVAVLALFAGGCGADDSPPLQATVPSPTAAATDPPATTPGQATAAATSDPTVPPRQDTSAAYQAYRAGPTACGAEQPPSVTPMAFASADDQDLSAEKTISAVIETSCGDIGIDLDPSLAPLTVNSFVFLANHGYFDGSVSHRIVARFMFQAGDPSATGTGGPGYRITTDEWPAPGFTYRRGVVAMANAGPGTTGSQFFIMLGDTGLPPNFTVIGRVVSGDDVLDAIAEIPVTERPSGEKSLPLESLYLERVRIVD